MDVSVMKRWSLMWLLFPPTIVVLMDSGRSGENVFFSQCRPYELPIKYPAEVSSSFTTRCIRIACNQHTSAITCNQSLILILDVTNLQMERERSAFEKMKRACMAKSSCDPSRICSPSDRSWLLVHYSCIDVSQIQHSACDGRTSKIQGKHGYIQSPQYPENTVKFIPCKWQIDLSNDSFLTLSVHDVATSGTRESCDGGLKVSGSDCDGRGQFAPRLLCGGDDLTSLVRCGKVDVELSDSKGLYPLRFWLSYYVQSKPQPASIRAPIRSCSAWLYTMGDSQLSGGGKDEHVTGDTIASTPSSGDQNDKQIFIILLFIFCGITIVLLIILIIVCIRCRQIRLSVSDHVYSEPSPGLQAHYDYISSLDDEKPRPKLVEEYFEVADALPEDQRGHLPTSPAYAEVEQFTQLRKGQWSSLGSSDWPDMQTGSNSRDEAEKMVYSNEVAGTSKSGIINKIVPDRFTKNSKTKMLREVQGQKDTGPKVYVVNLKNHPQQNKLVNNKSFDDEENAYDDSSTYEQIEVFSSKNNNIEGTETDKSKKRLPEGSQESGESNKRKNDKFNSKEKKGELNGASNAAKETSSMPSKVNQIKEGLFSKTSNVNSEGGRDKDNQCNSKVAGFQEKKNFPYNKQLEVLAARNRSQAAEESPNSKKIETDRQKLAKANLLKDGTKTQGIVKNGIRKFEHNTAL